MKFITIFIYVFVCTFLVSCKEATSSKRECKGTHVNVDVINNIGFKSVFAKMVYMLISYQWKMIPMHSW